MPHVIVAGKLHPSGRAILDATENLSVDYIDEVSEESYAPRVHEADAVLLRTQPMTAETIAKATRLKLVSRHGVGYDAVDVEALNTRGIPLAICGDVNSASVAEHAVMMLLAATKRVIRADKSVRSGPWEWRNKLEAQDVFGRTFLQIGYGRIGRRIVEMMGVFGVEARIYDPFLSRLGQRTQNVPLISDLEEALAWADLISISVPKADKPLIGAEELSCMKPGVVLVNTARGGIIDEAALVEALKSGQVGAAGLDVFEDEPIPEHHPLTQFDQVLLTPHIAGLTDGAAERIAIASAQNIVDFFNGRLNTDLVVNQQDLVNGG